MTQTSSGPVRLSEVVAALSMVTDLGMGQPMEQAMATCLLSVRAGRQLGLSDAELSDVYYLALLRFIGCTADASEFAAAVGGDDVGVRGHIAPVLNGEMSEYFSLMLRHYAERLPPLTRVRVIGAALVDGERSAKRSVADHCQVAQMLAPRLGISSSVALATGSTFERWDGKGIPGGIAAEAIPLACRIVTVARDVDVLSRVADWSSASDCLKRRRGRAYDPTVVDLFLESGATWLQEVREQQMPAAVVAAEPGPPDLIDDRRLDDVLAAFADLADLKCTYAAGHSAAVAELAAAAGRVMGLPGAEITDLRRAALLHDIGKVGIPNGILDKRGPLSSAEWERVRLHPYFTERVLSHVPAFERLADIAGHHHERPDGSGYHRGAQGAALPVKARILAASNAYQALMQTRPYRPALDTEARQKELTRKAAEGRLDQKAAQSVLEAAGHSQPPSRRDWPAGLTDREVEVLRLIAQGCSNRVVANQLTISVKTAGRHVENIYAKTGVSSRATAALFAMEHNLIYG